MVDCVVPPPPPVVRVHRVTSNSITLRWTGGDTGNSPVIRYRIKAECTNILGENSAICQ